MNKGVDMKNILISIFFILFLFCCSNDDKISLEEVYNFTDTYWSIKDLYINGKINYCTGLSDGSHCIWIEYNGENYIAHEDTLNKYIIDWQTLLLNGEIEPLRTDDFYVNIGKYDQFSGGWDDFAEYNTEPDTICMTPHRSEYLELRYKYNESRKGLF